VLLLNGTLECIIIFFLSGKPLNDVEHTNDTLEG